MARRRAPGVWFSLAVILMTALGAFAEPVPAQELQDVVYLKDGSVIRGTIVEQIPGESILIETADGNRFRYAMDLVARLARERPAAPSQPAPQLLQRPPKSPGTAWFLSFLIPGAGQFYNGDVAWGALDLLAHVVFSGWLAAELECVGSTCNESDANLAALFLIANWVGSQIHAYQGAKKINRAAGFASLEFMPRDGVRVIETPAGTRPRADLTVLRWTR